jgi:hypothetical protein
MRNEHNQVITSMDGVKSVFTHYKATMATPPPKPPSAKSPAPPTPGPVKTIRTFLTALPSGDTAELAPVARYDDAISSAREMGGVPESWTVTIVESNPTEIKMACASGPITPDMALAVQKRTVTALNLLPKGVVHPKSVMIKMIYHHIDENRKPARTYVTMRVGSDESRQELLEHWIREVRSGKNNWEPWLQRAQKMSKKESD